MKEKKSFPFSFIFSFIITALLVALIIFRLRGSSSVEVPLFRSLLDMFSSAPSIDISQGFQIGHLSKLTGSSILDFLYPLINSLIDLINFLIFLGSSLVNTLGYFVYFVGWLFGF